MDNLSIAFKSMKRFYNDIEKNPPYGISVTLPNPDDFTLWMVSMKGPKDTPYEHNTYKLELIHRDRFSPPSVRFVGRIPLHPNIGEDGTICLDILTNKESYPCAIAGENALISIQSLLSDPNPHECLRISLGALLLKDPDTYNEIIRMHCQGDDLLFDELINDK